MFAFKACPRCQRGDLFQDRQGEIVCVQCGYELPTIARVRFLAARSAAGQQQTAALNAA